MKTFDPQNFSFDQLLDAGLSNKIAKNIIAYRNAGGTFKRSKDLKKMFTIDDETYKLLKPYYKSNSNHKSELPNNQKISEKINTTKQFEINTVTATELIYEVGLDSILAFRLVKYRNSLGYFHNLNQLENVYGIDESSINDLKKVFTADSSYVRKININQVHFSDLLKHPDIDYRLAKHLINYRTKINGFKSWEDLKKAYLMDDFTFEKIKHYLVLNDN